MCFNESCCNSLGAHPSRSANAGLRFSGSVCTKLGANHPAKSMPKAHKKTAKNDQNCAFSDTNVVPYTTIHPKTVAQVSNISRF
jgi:hypothetical protein